MYVRTFLINTHLNGRGWAVNASSLAKHVLSFLKRPLILKRYPDGKIDHREWDSSLSASDNLRAQEQYKIGHIEKVLYDKDTDGYYADVNITNPEVEQWLSSRKASKIPIAVSPQIIYDKRKESNLADIKNWFGSHLAIVDRGAYGPQAIATNLCTSECPLELQKGLDASFDFSIPGALDAAASSFDTSLVASDVSNQYQQMAMIELKPDSGTGNTTTSGNTPGVLAPVQKEAPFMRDTNSKTPVPITNPAEQKPQQEQEKNIDYKQLFEQQKQELEAAKAKVAESQTVSERLTEHEKKIAKYEAEGKERAIKDAIPIFLSEFLDKKGQVNNDAIDAKVKDIIKRGFTADDVKYMYAEKVAAFEDAINKPAESKAANASNPNPIFEVPKIESANASTSVGIETPWFVNAASLLGKRQNFSKQAGRVL